MSRPPRQAPPPPKPAPLKPDPESVVLGAKAPEDESAPASAASESAAIAAPTIPAFDEKAKLQVTFQMRAGLKKRAESAVLHTRQLPGGHKSFIRFVESAITHELERAALEFNGGTPYEPNTGELPKGRPPGD